MTMALISYKEAMKNNMLDDFTITVKGKTYNGFYCPVKIKRQSLPLNIKAFSMRYSDNDDNVIETIMPNYCLINHHGDFLTNENLIVTEETKIEDYSFN